MRATNWFGLGLDAWWATLEAQQVIALRVAKITAGGEAGSREAHRMVSEKTAAAIQVQGAAVAAALSGASASIPARTVSAYRRKVRANRRRLLKDYGL